MPSTSASPNGGPPSFFRTELERALSEQTFGISGFSMGPTSAHEATATVELLEHTKILVTLTFRGYQVTGGLAPVANNVNEEFETLDALLQHHSPLYSAKRTDLLIAKLSA